MLEAPSANTIEVVNPATLEKICEVPIQTSADVQAAYQRSRRAFQDWSQGNFEARAALMWRLRDYLLDHRDEVAEVICSETGKPKSEALLLEVTYICFAIDFYAKHAKRFLRDRGAPLHWLLRHKKVFTAYHPVGAVGFICPWNFPLTLTLGETIPALMAGNTVIIKPSEFTPRTAMLAAEICEKVGFPAGVVQTVTGDGSTGAALIEAADMISFTGSVATGRRVLEAAAKRLIPVVLELGGKDPMVVLKDADVERAANAAVWGAFANSGQICMSVERVYVEAPIAEAFTQRVVEKTRKLRQGIDHDFSVDVGSMTMPRQLQIVERHVADAVRKGAIVLTGGRRNPNFKGLFYEPTVLDKVDHSMEIMTEETFGPVLPIMRVCDENEALRLANDSRYGLNSSIWSGDQRKGLALARRLQAGNVCVNDCMVNFVATGSPFGGIKESGLGHRHGEAGIRRYCTTQSVLVDKLGLTRELTWYPYSKKSARIMTRALNFFFHSSLRKKLMG
ncbi:MAG: aldehyde dehydrogenase family protein [Acidobacteria bacterium]|nr:aldehyde dehydrogenase family protein [Acidobacteriota bacterium]MBI3655715.1 aldehyde dehydrogenase family protein [Acidobacteriota bacterium]